MKREHDQAGVGEQWSQRSPRAVFVERPNGEWINRDIGGNFSRRHDREAAGTLQRAREFQGSNGRPAHLRADPVERDDQDRMPARPIRS
jgi:hypothetical protein